MDYSFFVDGSLQSSMSCLYFDSEVTEGSNVDFQNSLQLGQEVVGGRVVDLGGGVLLPASVYSQPMDKICCVPFQMLLLHCEPS